MKKYYIYAHLRKDTNNIFYIGKGSGNRAYFENNRSLFWKRIVNKYGYNVKILKSNLTEEEAYNLETNFISSEKNNGNCEANFTLGGDGVRVEKRWWNEKISNSLKGIKRKTGKANKNFKDVISKEKLVELYPVKKQSTTQIAKMVGISIPTVCQRLKEYDIQIRPAGQHKKGIKCINDNNIFDSIAEASRFYGIFRENIRKVLQGKYQQTNNLKFKYHE